MPIVDTSANQPTYHWTAAAGAVASITGLVALAVCIAVSASHPTSHGYAAIPAGVSALASLMTLGGLVLLAFRILHADCDEIMRRLEAMDEKLDDAWEIQAARETKLATEMATRMDGMEEDLSALVADVRRLGGFASASPGLVVVPIQNGSRITRKID